MGNNKEIRNRMEIYRRVLLVLNWVGSIALIIVGFAMIDLIGGLAFIIIIMTIILGIIGHFLVNVALAIPFILLNNGDYLVAMAQKNGTSTISYNDNAQQTLESDTWVCKKCGFNNRKTALFCNDCGEKK
jgi:hypothetical protein